MAIEGQLMPRHFASAEFLYQRLQVASDKPAYRQHLRDRAGVSGGWAPYEPPRPRSAGTFTPETEYTGHPGHHNVHDDIRAYGRQHGRAYRGTVHEFGEDNVQARSFAEEIRAKSEAIQNAFRFTVEAGFDGWGFTGWDETASYDHESPEFLKSWEELRRTAERVYGPPLKAEPVRHGKAKSQAPRVKQGKGKRRGRWDNG